MDFEKHFAVDRILSLDYIYLYEQNKKNVFLLVLHALYYLHLLYLMVVVYLNKVLLNSEFPFLFTAQFFLFVVVIFFFFLTGLNWQTKT